MGNALKILGVDFSGSAVTQVVYDEEIPCTSIQLNTSTLSFDTVDETYQLVATVLPNDTTDVLVWESSDENVATVVNGLVTIHGIGNAIITVTCGSQSASAAIAQTAIKSNYAIRGISGATLVENYNNYMVAMANASVNAFGKPYTNADDLRIGGSTNTDLPEAERIEQFPVPYGATKAKVALLNDETVTLSQVFFCDRTNIYSHEEYPVGIVSYPHYSSKLSSVNSSVGFTVSETLCFCFKIESLGNKQLDYIYFE